MRLARIISITILVIFWAVMLIGQVAPGKQASMITGSDSPDSEPAIVCNDINPGQKYFDKAHGETYQCDGALWRPVEGGGSPKSAPTPISKVTAGANSPPAIPDSLAAKFSKAQKKLEDARVAFGEAVKELQAACGKEFQPQMDSKGDPVCAAAPAPAKPETKKP